MIGIITGVVEKVGSEYLYIKENKNQLTPYKVYVKNIKGKSYKKGDLVCLNVKIETRSESGKYGKITTYFICENELAEPECIKLKNKPVSIEADVVAEYPAVTISVRDECNPSIRLEYNPCDKQYHAIVWKDEWSEPIYNEKIC